MNEFQIILDVWEGSLDIEEDTLLDAGVIGLFPRINDISGGHHGDENFLTQWKQTKSFPVRVPYFVYNPWVSGSANFEYLGKIMPKDAGAVMLDIEVKYTGYTATKYAEEVGKFYELCKDDWTSFIYTGGWFYFSLSYWPDVDYCIARYPYTLYPKKSERWTWEKLKTTLSVTKWYPGLAPNTQNGVLTSDRVRLWQCSGDRLILPGTKNRPIDIIVFPGNLENLTSWLGGYREFEPVLSVDKKVDVLWNAHQELWN